MSAKLLTTEKQEHREAFEIYFLLSDEKRSIREVARQIKKSPSTVATWAKSFNWEEKLAVRQAHIARQFKEVQKANDDTLVDTKSLFFKILKQLIADAVTDIKEKKLKVYDVKELLKVMDMALRLLGEEDRQQQNHFQQMVEALQASATMFGVNPEEYTYDENDESGRGEDNDSST